MVRCVLTSLVSVAVLASLTGCGGATGSANRPATTRANATVTYKGQSVEGASVILSPDDKTGKPATGRTGTNGVAKLMTFVADDGAVPGAYKVSVTKTDAPASSDAPVGGANLTGDDYTKAFARAGGPKGAAPAKTKDLLPAKYKTPDGSGLTATIKAGEENNVKLELTD